MSIKIFWKPGYYISIITDASRQQKLYSQGKWPEVQPAESHVTPLPIHTHTNSAPRCYVTLGVRVTAAGEFISVLWCSCVTFCTGLNRYLLVYVFAFPLNTHMHSEDTRVMKTHWTPILQGEQPKKHGERKREGPETKQRGAAQEKHWAVWSCVPSPLCVFSHVLTDGSAYI